jgi:argonaute-like protein implicated in RNA metabolism and viral defense
MTTYTEILQNTQAVYGDFLDAPKIANTALAMNKQIISVRIMKEITNGSTIEQAIDTVLGAGTYVKIVAETYAALSS